MKISIGVIIGVAALIAAPSAVADDSSYLGSLGYHLWPNDAMVRTGHWTCDEIRSGRETPASVISSAPATMPLAMDVQAMVSAAQHQLCPDTL